MLAQISCTITFSRTAFSATCIFVTFFHQIACERAQARITIGSALFTGWPYVLQCSGNSFFFFPGPESSWKSNSVLNVVEFDVGWSWKFLNLSSLESLQLTLHYMRDV